MNAEDNAAAWRAVIMHAEGTSKNTNPYSVMFGGGTFDNTKKHPDKVVHGGKYSSAAAGAYQFMPETWAALMGDAPMTKENQDKAAAKLAAGRGVDIRTAPFTRENVAKLAPEWASFPTLGGQSYYGQPVKSYGSLEAIFNQYRPSSFVQQASDHLTKKYGVKPKPVVIPTLTKTKKNTFGLGNVLKILGKQFGDQSQARDPSIPKDWPSRHDAKPRNKTNLMKIPRPGGKFELWPKA